MVTQFVCVCVDNISTMITMMCVVSRGMFLIVGLALGTLVSLVTQQWAVVEWARAKTASESAFLPGCHYKGLCDLR